MKYWVIIIVLCLQWKTGIAQRNIKSSRFIEELITQTNVNEAALIAKVLGKGDVPTKSLSNDMFYQDSVGTYVVRNMRDGLKRYTTNTFRGVRNDSVYMVDDSGKRIVLSTADAHKRSFNSIGADGRIPYRIERILSDSLVITAEERLYINTQIGKMKDSVWGNNDFLSFRLITTDTVNAILADRKRGWTEMYKRGINRFYVFSVPIFIRNDTYCFFYYGYSCGWRCGQGRFAIYRKEKGKWMPFVVLSEWIS